MAPKLFAAGLAIAAPAALAGPIIDFETYDDLVTPLEHGRQLSTVAGQYERGLFTITSSADNANGGGRAAIFDTDLTGTVDPDLEVDLGNALMIQSDNPSGRLDQTVTSGIYDIADDEAGGGFLQFDFTQPVYIESLVAIDINGAGNFDLFLEDSNGLVREWDVPNNFTFDIDSEGPLGWDTLFLNTDADQTGEGGGTATVANEDAGFNVTQVVQMRIEFAGSAAIDNLTFVPGPGSLLALGGVGILGLGRRRSPA